jgi:hypothetical protein
MKSLTRATAICCALFLSSPSAYAVFKCTEKGKTTFSDIPCPNTEGTQQQTVKIAAPPPVDEKNVARLEQETKTYQRQEARKKAAEEAIEARRVIPFMTPSEVRRAIGEPTRINANGGKVQWVYRYAGGDTRYIYFVNDLTE